MENLKRASVWTTCLEKFKRSYVPPKTHVSKILCCVALAVYKSYFFSEQPFYVNYLTFHILAIIWNRSPLFVSYWLANQQWLFNTPIIGFGSFSLSMFCRRSTKIRLALTTNFPQNIETVAQEKQLLGISLGKIRPESWSDWEKL